MRRFVYAGILLAIVNCEAANASTYAESMRACARGYPTERMPQSDKGKLDYLLDFNDCEKRATETTLPALPVDLVELAYSKKAAIYEKITRRKMTPNEAQVQFNQIDTDLLNSSQQRVDKNNATMPTITDCSPNDTGGFICSSR